MELFAGQRHRRNASGQYSPELAGAEYIKTVYRPLIIVLIVLFSFGPTVSVGQSGKNDSSALLKELLAMAAPTPRGAATPVSDEYKMRPLEFYSRRTAPPDDAPIGDLLAYWERWMYMGATLTPTLSPVVQQRLVDHCFENPDKLPRFLTLFPSTEKVTAKVKEIYDKAADDETVEPVWRDNVKNWLLFNSDYYLDELLSLAHRVKDMKDGRVNKEEALVSLAKLDWTNAEPLVRSLLGSGQPRSSALAASLFYVHANQEKDVAAEENYRRVLQQIARDSAQPGYARNIAIHALGGGTDWSGRDEWYLNLFQDETLLSLEDSNVSFSPLCNLFQSDPDKWTPGLARLLEGKDVKVRTAAASCLLTFQGEESRKDALLPLLPWLTDPAWITETDSSLRPRLIQSLSYIDVPESVPGLIAVLENKNETPYVRSYAGNALARYKDKGAAPVLRRALAAEKDEGNRHRLISGLMECQGILDAEQLDAIEAFAEKVSTTAGMAEIYGYNGETNPLPLPVSIGRYLAQLPEPPVPLVRAVLARAESLKQQNPALAQIMLGLVHQWQGRLVDFDMLNRIANGTADARAITTALIRREKMIENLRPEMEGLAAAGGIAPGVGAVLLNDGYLVQSVLTSGDRSAQIALLACSRLTQTPLPVEIVGTFLGNKNELLARAAELYLLAEDSHEARELLWRHHANKAYVTGWREAGSITVAANLAAMSEMEEKLRAELFEANGPVEIFALVGSLQPYRRVLRIYSDKAVYTDYEDTARYRERTVTKAEVSTFKDYLTTNAILDLGPTVESCHDVCTSQEFLAITKEKGRRVFSQLGFIDRRSLSANFDELGVGARTHYNLEKEIKGLEVLLADSELTALDVWQQDGQLRVYIEREEETVEPEQPADSDDEDEDRGAKFLEGIRRDVTRNQARLSWRAFENDELGDVVSQPDGYSIVDPLKFLSSEFYDKDDFANDAIMLTPNSIVMVSDGNGLWKQFAGAPPVRIGDQDADYVYGVVTGDRKWLVVAKAKSETGDPYHIVRMNLQTGREFKVKLEPADDLSPITFIPNLGKILVRRARGENNAPNPVGPERPEYYLLDAATGETRPVSGEFAPLEQPGDRFLQPTGKPDEYWAAIPDEAKNQTRVGRYNVRDFSFKPVMLVPHIVLDSLSMWVDAKQGKIYVVYRGQLLRLPLEATAAAAAAK